MEKFNVIFSNGTEVAVWAIDKKAAKFHLQPTANKYNLKIIKVEKIKSVA